MKRISFTRPKEKVKGAERRLKAFNEWCYSFDDFIPPEWCEDRYCDFSLPVLDRLLDPPTTKPEWQQQAIDSLFVALSLLHKTKSIQYKDVPIDLIITWPNLSGSRLILFFDKSYHNRFYQSDGERKKRIPEKFEAAALPFKVTLNIKFRKVKFMNRDYDGEETTVWYIEDWYVFTI